MRFTSSFAWMMAFAMKQGASEIALYGIDMASRDEYILQRPGFYFFRHEAKRRGIKVLLASCRQRQPSQFPAPPASRLLDLLCIQKSQPAGSTAALFPARNHGWRLRPSNRLP